ncbi:intradiol ring-cleavage dioxygenase [Streptomyces stelliscabiei]|uniref:Protocatechuate 3,4-dioxygenase beta subunit n=1 Tax=Streptomyces stelliscabiei TaxID=146820 RepID=A0A8I0PA08_9ACTN|nr:intradiol ring-cleavage dioxygenase [Streptomyces stelliscabiei]KND44046.1 dioxygenase [Streptomyces stelliscabiei]MBE1598635.1 protocatechuate 3,4-dioxygenase beta subunit [Streptomyces stelliscabiei]MDX2516573.1 intradiol ring-cleavage dioxygenase [Streptomyces stelliscabiei]
MTGNQTGDEKAHGPRHKRDLTRRKVVVAGAGAVAAVGVGGAVVATASAGTNAGKGSGSGEPLAATSAGAGAGEDCYKLTSETTEGPYYIDADKLRQDITEDKEGIPFTLRLKVIDAETCKPLRNAAVDIWHCDALGLYSGYESFSEGGGTPPTDAPSGTPTDVPTGEPPAGGGGGGGGHEEPTSDTRYLRGTWKTDRQGLVTFETIFPGWYRGRCVHIHTKVHVDGEWTDAGYEGGTTCHTGQFFFDEEAVLDSAEVEPYSTSTTERTTLDDDTIYDGSGVQGGLLKLKYRKKNDIARGVVGSITVGVDPEATHTGTDDSVQPGASATASESASAG